MAVRTDNPNTEWNVIIDFIKTVSAFVFEIIFSIAGAAVIIARIIDKAAE